MKIIGAATLILTGCGLFAPDPDAQVREAAIERLNADDSDPGHPYTVLRVGKAAPWRRQDADVQQARHMEYDIEKLVRQQEEIGPALQRLQRWETSQELKPLSIRYTWLHAEANRLFAVQDSLLHTTDTTRIGSRILLVYRSEFLGTVDSSTFIVLPNEPVQRMLEAP
ncbi:hypothetical protein EJV47_21160 [Hymenobacter gummosus]|uniref:Uncharacterized protein n=1 Tax=Hymenobacter gummosus TaxID=1776032 RepID=A0A431TY18_9BACT|nr:hypothetical protein [Hymenobacter gummosus]RTQ46882.1 hypothetical protein EJV47_21160 [Hymenobacter gummosus]